MPEFALARIVFAAGVFEVIAEMLPPGLVVVQVNVALQVLAPAAMVQEAVGGVRVPDTTAAWHVLPFQVVPDAQVAVATLLPSSKILLYRKNVRLG